MPEACNFIKKTMMQLFFCDVSKIYNNTFLLNTFGRLLLVAKHLKWNRIEFQNFVCS